MIWRRKILCEKSHELDNYLKRVVVETINNISLLKGINPKSVLCETEAVLLLPFFPTRLEILL